MVLNCATQTPGPAARSAPAEQLSALGMFGESSGGAAFLQAKLNIAVSSIIGGCKGSRTAPISPTPDGSSGQQLWYPTK